MVDPRIYRGFLILVAFAVIVFGFSLQNQPHGLGTSIAPGQFFASSGSTLTYLEQNHPGGAPGSPGDEDLASYVQKTLNANGFTAQTEDFSAHTALGSRVLETVTATRPGLEAGTIVVVSHRDSAGTPGAKSLSGTATLLGLEGALGGETLHRSVMLVSTSGRVGAAGATRLAHELAGQSVDAVILLGDLAGTTVRSPVVVPWSSSDRLAPPVLRNTLAKFVAAETGIRNDGNGIAGQFGRLAFPFAITEQAPFAAEDLPAVLLSLSGDRTITNDSPHGSSTRLTELGAAVLQTVNSLDEGPTVAAPSSYLLLSGKEVPLWAMRLLVLALILPVAATTLDAVARTRRRGHGLSRWVAWVLTGAMPFLVGLVALLIARVSGLLSATPPGAVGAGGVKLTGGDTAVLLVVLLLVVLSFVFLRPLALRGLSRMSESARRPESPAADAAAVALSVVMCLLAAVVLALNPYAALLLVPALHLWLWLAQPGARSRRWSVAVLLLLPIVPALLVLIYYLNAYGLTPLDLAWSLALMPGGAVSIATAAYWAVALGCLASAIVIGSRAARAAATTPEPAVTVRGPTSYAGPGSLGGTESALRR